MRKRIFFLIFIISTNCSIAQLPEYCVKNIKGVGYIIKSNGKKIKLAINSFLFKEDKIELAKSISEVTLLNYDNFYVVLSKPGNYLVSELINLRVPEKTGITKKYVKLIWHEMFEPETPKDLLSPSNIAGSWGAAERSDCQLPLFPLYNAIYFTDTLFFIWNKLDNVEKYYLKIADISKHEIFTIITKDTVLGILKRDVLKEESSIFFWNVTALSNECTNIPMKRFKLFNSKSLALEEMNLLIKAVPTEDNEFIYNLKIADKLGQNGWYNEAAIFSEKAIKSINRN